MVSGSSNQPGGLVAAGNPAQQPTPMAQRRQDAWELQLKEKAFLVASIKPIVDDTTTFKPTVPFALREVKRSMDKGVYFKDNTYGPAGLAGPAHATTMHEYGTWAQWAQTPAGNIAERDEGISNYVKSLTLNAYISEYGTQDERNDGRNQETAALAFIHMESFAELDELRRETMMTTTTAFAAVKNPVGRGSAGAGSAMRAEKPEKMVPEMQTLELIDELKTRKNGDDMSWDGFKHILGSYPGIKTKFNNYLNKHETDVVWRAKAQPEQVREFITEFLDSFDDPGVRAKEAVERALRFRQKKQMTTGTYLELKELRFDEALREGNTSGHVDTRIRDEPERCRNAVEHLLTEIEVAVRDHLTDVSLAGHNTQGYAMDHFTEWTVMAKQVRRLAIHKRLDPKSSSNVTPYGKNMMKSQDSESENEQEGRKNDRTNTFKNRWKNREARVAQDGGGGERKGPMLCSSLPNQSAFKQGDERVMPPRRPGGPPNNFGVYHWHEVGCKKKGSCVYGGHVTKVDYDKDPEKYKNMDFSKKEKKAAKEQAAVAAPAQTASLEAKFESMIELVKNISAAQQESSAAVMEFKKKQVSADLDAQKESARRKARHEARQAASNVPGGSAFDQSWDEQLSFMTAGDESEGDS